MKRKTVAALAAVCLVFCLILAGCGEKNSPYPPIDTVNPASIKLETTSNDTVSVQFPAEEWSGKDGSSPLTIDYADTIGAEQQRVNISVHRSGTYSGKLTEKYLSKLMESYAESLPNVKFNSSEMRSLNGKTVILTESVSQFTDEAIDFFLKQGSLTQEYIDSVGGRDFLLSIPPTDQITLYVVTGAYLYVYTGTYYEESQRADVLEALTVMAQTTAEVK